MAVSAVHLAPWFAALWWGSLTILGGLVVPLLFVHLPSPALAGGMAAKLFAAQTWVSTVCGVLLLLLQPRHTGQQVLRMVLLLGVLLALLSEFAIAPKIVSRENLRLWHSVGSVMYGLQWLCAGVVFKRVLADTHQAIGPLACDRPATPSSVAGSGRAC